jgi:hypothetical protein
MDGGWKQSSADLMREMDELWYHLTQAGELDKLKKKALLNIKFLMATVHHASISYLRSVLELIRAHFLDWELEVLLLLTKNCMALVSQQPDQLAVELLAWLRPFCSHLPKIQSRVPGPAGDLLLDVTDSGETQRLSPLLVGEYPVAGSLLLDKLMRKTWRWCIHKTNAPLLVPLSSWLHLQLPTQVTSLQLPFGSCTNALLTHDRQHLICSQANYLHVMHLPSKQLLRTIEGESYAIRFAVLWPNSKVKFAFYPFDRYFAAETDHFGCKQKALSEHVRSAKSARNHNQFGFYCNVPKSRKKQKNQRI